MIITVFVARIRLYRCGRCEYFKTFVEAANVKQARWLLEFQYDKGNVLNIQRK